MKITSILFIILFFISFAWAEDESTTFEHFSLTPKMLAQVQSQQQTMAAKKADLNWEDIISGSELYRRISQGIGGNYRQIGATEATNILSFNRTFDLGKYNFSGFTWQKPLGNISIGVHREIVPYLFRTDKWEVRDRFVVHIDAFSYLSNLRENGQIQIGDTQLGLFAGLFFQRVYRMVHFAPSYAEGLASDFDKLFMSYLYLNQNKIFTLGPQEKISREDFLSFAAGGMFAMPIHPMFSVNAGVLVEGSLYAKLEAVRLGSSPATLASGQEESLRVAIQKEIGISTDLQISLAADFAKILRLTLVSFDLNFDFKKSEKMHLRFYQRDEENLRSVFTKEGGAFFKLLHFYKLDEPALKDNIVAMETSKKLDFTTRFYLLLMGANYQSGSEQIRIDKEDKKYLFYRYLVESDIYIENVLTKMFALVIQMLTKFSLPAGRYLSMEKSFLVEYKVNESKYPDRKWRTKEESISIRINRDLYSLKNWLITRQAIQDFLNKYTNVNSEIKKALYNRTLQGPVAVTTRIQVTKEGVQYFNELPPAKVKQLIVNFCSDKGVIVRAVCRVSLREHYENYYEEMEKRALFDVKKLKKFLYALQRYTSGRKDYGQFFGLENVFFNGQLTARTKNKQFFMTYFTDGTYKNSGVVDELMSSEGLIYE